MRVLALLIVAVILSGTCVASTGQRRRISPHETTTAAIDGAEIAVAYGRPSMRGRIIMGGLVPYDHVWATGADEATTLTTTRALKMGGFTLPAGRYTLWTLPSPDRWKLIVNKQTGQWHTQYHESQDLVRLDMDRRQLAAPVEQLTISIDKDRDDLGGVLRIAWETTEVSIPFTVE